MAISVKNLIVKVKNYTRKPFSMSKDKQDQSASPAQIELEMQNEAPPSHSRAWQHYRKSTTDPETPVNKKLLNSLFFLACVLLGLFHCSVWGAPPEKVRLQLKWYHQFQFAGYYAAQSQGFYRDEGLDVELIEGASDRPPDKMVLENKAEFGIHDGGDLVYRRLQGAPLVAVATIFQHSPYVIISKKSSGIRHPSDLVGRTVPITQDQGSAQILAMFCREGIKVKNVFDQEPVHFVPHPWNFDDFVAGRVVATAAYITELPRFKQLYGYEPVIMNPLDYGIDFYGDTLFASSEFLKAKPDVAERFRRASLKGWQYAMEHREEIVDVILALPSARQTRPGRQELLDEAQAMNDIILPTLVELGNMNPGRWEKMAQVYRELGMVTSTGNLDGFIYAIDAEKQAFRKQLRLLGGVLAAITLLAIISLVWVRMLRSQVLLRTRELADDIATRTRVEDALRLSAERLQLATRAANIGIWDWDIVQNELVWDDSMYQLYGIQKGSFGGAYDAWLRTLHPDDKAYTDGEIQAALRGEHEYAPEFRIVRPDGSIRYIKADSQTIKSSEGKPLRMIGTNFDITERKRILEAMQRSQSALEEAQRIAHIGSWDVDIVNDVLFWSDEIFRIWEIDKTQFKATFAAFLETVHPEDRDKVAQAYNQAIIDKSLYQVEHRLLFPDGRVKYIDERGEPYFDEDERPVRFIGTSLDITERKRAETALTHLAAIVESSSDGIIGKTPDGIITSWNQGAEWIYGYSADEIIGKHVSVLAPSSHHAEINDFQKKVLEGGTIVNYESERIRKDGTLIQVALTLSPIRDKSGNITGISTIARDISERKHMEAELALAIAELKRSEQLFRSLAENSPDVIIRYDREGRRIYVNPEFERFNRLSAQDVLGKTPVEISTELAPVAKFFTEKLMAVMASGVVSRIDLSWEKDGKSMCWFVRAVPEFDADGKVVSALTIWSDITERKNAEDKINELNRNLELRVEERTAQLEAANKELEAFSYSVSHDLRSPLRAIDGFSRILLDEYTDKLDDEGKRLLKVVRDNTSRMGQLIDDILNFSRTGRLELSFSEIDMEKLAHEVFEEIQPSAGCGKLQVEIEAIPSCSGDCAMMRQVFVNLLSNAIKFTSLKERATIKVGGSTEGNEAVYFVRDNGAGFDMQYADKLFGVFQRLHSINEFEGTGIGLAIVKRIITRHGGRVWAESKVNEGSTIYFALPILKTQS